MLNQPQECASEKKLGRERRRAREEGRRSGMFQLHVALYKAIAPTRSAHSYQYYVRRAHLSEERAYGGVPRVVVSSQYHCGGTAVWVHEAGAGGSMEASMSTPGHRGECGLLAAGSRFVQGLVLTIE